jgi:RNA 2',3'-cyclic 3'-phosphodiesterase
MRLFVALKPPSEAVAELDGAVAALREQVPGLRWTAPAQWHLTLTFLGEVTEGDVPHLCERLGRAASRSPALLLRFRGGGRFGRRVLFTHVDGSRDQLRRLAAGTTAAARRTGLAVEDRPYRPHLTLARADGGPDLSPLVAALHPFEGSGWEANEVHLVRSRLGAGEGRRSVYEDVDAWPLGGT